MKRQQPRAIAFCRTQIKFAEHILEKTNAMIDNLERANPDDPDLDDLYDDQYYWSRFIRHMGEQRERLHEQFIDGSDW